MGLIVGSKSLVSMYDEVTWGTKPGAPTYYDVPVSTYNVRYKPETRRGDPFIGVFQRKHAKNYRGMPAGQMALPLYGWRPTGMTTSLAEYFLTWAFGSHELFDLPSKGVEWLEGPGVADKNHHGLRVAGATLSGSSDTGIIELSLDLMGKSETEITSARTAPNDRKTLAEFEFPDMSLTIGGSPVSVDSFQLQVQHGLKPEYLNSRAPSQLTKLQRVLNFSCVPLKDSNTYDAYYKATTQQELAIVLTMKGLHVGTGSTGSWAQGVATMSRCSFIDADTQGGKADIWKQPLSFDVLKPDSASNDVSFAWSEV